jgi:hypothetical protein
MSDENERSRVRGADPKRKPARERDADRDLRDRDPARSRSPSPDVIPEAPPPGQEDDPFAGLQPIDDQIDQKEPDRK